MKADERSCVVYTKKVRVYLLVPNEHGVVTVSFGPGVSRAIGEAMVAAANHIDRKTVS